MSGVTGNQGLAPNEVGEESQGNCCHDLSPSTEVDGLELAGGRCRPQPWRALARLSSAAGKQVLHEGSLKFTATLPAASGFLLGKLERSRGSSGKRGSQLGTGRTLVSAPTP